MALPIRQILGGNPYRDEYKPKKRELLEWLETVLGNQTGANAGALIVPSKTALDALSPAANTMAWVIGDPNPDLDGVYQRSGSTWVKRGPLPYNIVYLNDDGGTANAIEVTTAFGLPSAAFGVLMLLEIQEANTGAVTLSINGATAKPLRLSNGDAIDAGYLQPGMTLLLSDAGAEYRLLTYGDVEAAVEAAYEQIRDALVEGLTVITADHDLGRYERGVSLRSDATESVLVTIDDDWPVGREVILENLTPTQDNEEDEILLNVTVLGGEKIDGTDEDNIGYIRPRSRHRLIKTREASGGDPALWEVSIPETAYFFDAELYPIQIATFAEADTFSIPEYVLRVYVNDIGMNFTRKPGEPASGLKFLNNGQWWGADEEIVYPRNFGETAESPRLSLGGDEYTLLEGDYSDEQAADAYGAFAAGYDAPYVQAAWYRTSSDALPERRFGIMRGVTADQSAKFQDFLDAAFEMGRPMEAAAGVCRIEAPLIMYHPTKFTGGGTGVSVLQFGDFGGFAGEDGITISVPSDARYKSESRISGMDLLALGGNGRCAIKTPVNAGGNGNTLFNTVRPKFTFDNLTIGGAVRRAAGANMHTVHGWEKCIHSGESADSLFENLSFMQPFLATDDPGIWANKDVTHGIFLQAGAADASGGPIYKPLINNCSGHGNGRSIRMEGLVSVPRVAECEFFANGWGGVYSESPLSTGGLPSAPSELTIEHCQFNGIYGGSKFKALDYADISDVRCTDTSFGAGTVDYSGDWFGLQITDEVPQIDINGFRAYAARVSATSQHTGIRITGRSSGGGEPSVINVTDFFWQNRTSGEAYFDKAIHLTNVSTHNLVAAWGKGNIGDLLFVDGAVDTSPRINVLAQKIGAITRKVAALDTGVSNVNLRYLGEARYKSVDPSTIALTTTGSEDLIVNQSNQVLRRSMNVNAVHTMNFLATNAEEGDSFHIHLTMLSGAPGTAGVVFRDNAAVTQLTINGTSATARYFVEMVYTGSLWRIIKAGPSLQ